MSGQAESLDPIPEGHNQPVGLAIRRGKLLHPLGVLLAGLLANADLTDISDRPHAATRAGSHLLARN
jgi:hypothetical protein